MDIFEHANNMIKDLMKEKNESQTYVAESILGTQQSNLSAALNSKNSRRLTLEQYIALADHWDISLDALFGREKEEQKVSISARSICEWIMYILKTKRARLESVTIGEKDLTEAKDFYGDIPRKAHTYSALVFPNYDTTSKSYEYHLSMREKHDGGIYVNEDQINQAINAFIKDFTELEDFKNSNNLPEKAYQAAVNAYLDEVSSKPYISMDEQIKENAKSINNEFAETMDYILSNAEKNNKDE